jgi:hypothetical protein
VNDLELLRLFEPVACYTVGEQFFPTAIDGYVQRASLWASSGRGQPRRLVPEGELDAACLVSTVEATPAATFYLRFTDQPLDVAEYSRWRHDRAAFRAPGRLTRVGLLARIVDTLFDASFLIRGSVADGATSIAAAKYRAMRAADERFVYYGRVVRVGGYIVLNYWFFYVMNPWRSGFLGANDHEADWEQVLVYLSDEGDQAPIPRWVAYAQHNFSGDDLRRRWDDPELRRIGDHPVVFVGAGSHANYFEPGEYLMGVEPAVLRPVRTVVSQMRRFWAERLRQGLTDSIDQEVTALFSVPFVDYARGDGLRIGPGEAHAWSPLVLREESAWVEGYPGLWGLDTRDPFGGERAPSGPKYNRDGTVRASWYDPLGWAGLDKVSPPSTSQRDLARAVRQLADEQAALRAQVDEQRSAVRRLALEQQALGAAHARGDERLGTAELELHELARRESELEERLAASRAHLARLVKGDPGDPQAHLHHKHRPEAPLSARAWLVELWSALSAGVLIAALGGLVVLAPAGWPLWVLLVVGVSILIEAAAQHKLIRALLNVTIILAIATLLILIKDFWQLVIIVSLLGFLITMVIQNLREMGRT